MSNSTFSNQRTESIAEEYRFTFIHYLDIVKELITLRTGLEYVADFQEILETGLSLNSREEIKFQRKVAIKAGKILYHRYGFDYSRDGFKYTAVHLEKELGVVKGQEEFLWKRLTSIVDMLYEQNKAWYHNDANKHREIMLESESALDRVLFYKKELTKFNELPPSPNMLEITFYCLYDGLIHIAPFSLSDQEVAD